MVTREEIVLQRIQNGCPACGKKWSRREKRLNLPMYGAMCERCHGINWVRRLFKW